MSEDVTLFLIDGLSVQECILLWKGRICTLSVLHKQVLQMLHGGQPGISAMESLARLHVYWPL